MKLKENIMKLRLRFLTIAICAIVTIGFEGHTHWAPNPDVETIAGTKKTTHKNTDDGFLILHNFYNAVMNSKQLQDASAWANCEKKVKGPRRSVGTASATIYAPETTSLGRSKGKYHVRAETEPGWWTGPKVDEKRAEYNGQVNRSVSKSSTNWGNTFLSHVTCYAKAFLSNRTGDAWAEGNWDGDPHIWPK